MVRPDYREKILGHGTIRTGVTESADAVVVGSGPGGAVVAAELAERGVKVVLLEEGGYFHPSEYTQDAADAFIRMYRDGGSGMTVGLPPISLPLGKCVGGTAMINSGTCFRTPDWILKKWRMVFGIEGCAPGEMAPYFDRVEERCHVEELPRDVWGKNAEVVKRGADKLGLSFKPLRHNARGCKGCGTCVLGCPDGAKESPNVNYVPSAIDHGAKVYCRAQAESVLVDGGKAKGVTGWLLNEDGTERVTQIRVNAPIVVLAAGALHTPALLLHNKLANSSRQVGKNLTIHPASRVSGMFEEEIKGWIGVPQGTYIDDFAPDGIMMEGIAVPPSIGAPLIPYVGMEHKELMARYGQVAAYGVMISDTSRGTVKNTKLFPHVFYQLNKSDTKKILRGIAILARIFFAAGAKTVFANVAGVAAIEEKDIPKIEDRKPKAMDVEMMAFHPLGTCRMSTDPGCGVVDANMETHDVKNLFIADGSVFPSSLGVNPQITIMAFATKCAEHIAQKG